MVSINKDTKIDRGYFDQKKATFAPIASPMHGKVIIIDDDPISILVSETMMKKHGFASSVLTFESPKDALNHLREDVGNSGGPDLIFLDVQMPDLSGWELLEEYSKLPAVDKRAPHVVMLSATFYPEDEGRARENPLVIDLVSKPVNAQMLERFT